MALLKLRKGSCVRGIEVKRGGREWDGFARATIVARVFERSSSTI
jgi:hypothetical protein